MKSRTVMSGAVLVAASLCFAGVASASGDRGAHVHGEGEINVVVAGTEVLMELSLPGADVVGFEHKAEADADIAAVQHAIETLENAGGVFALPGAAGCELAEAHVESSLLEHEDDHGHKDEHAAEHGGFSALYEFTCSSPDALRDIEVGLFTLFPSLEEIRIQAVTSRGQWAKELTSSDNQLLLVF